MDKARLARVWCDSEMGCMWGVGCREEGLLEGRRDKSSVTTKIVASSLLQGWEVVNNHYQKGYFLSIPSNAILCFWIMLIY